MSFSVKEIYYTIQGEGFHAGRPAVFCRFAACNLWTGREDQRERAVCQFCDTEFVGTDGERGGTYPNAHVLADAIRSAWPDTDVPLFVVLTGGEPMLQVNRKLIDVLHEEGFEIALETNGTKPVVEGIDWVTVSPKAGAELVQRSGHELKLVFPQAGIDPASLEELDFQEFFLQPMDGPAVDENTRLAAAYCLAHPRWRLSLQIHKMLGMR